MSVDGIVGPQAASAGKADQGDHDGTPDRASADTPIGTGTPVGLFGSVSSTAPIFKVSPVVTPFSQVAAAVRPLLVGNPVVMQGIGDSIKSAFREIGSVWRSLDVLLPNMGRFAELIEQRSVQEQTTIRSLLDRGWFISADFDFTMLGELSAMFAQADFEEADRFMSDLVESHLEDIFELACSRYPDRADVLNQALLGHRASWYALAIPAILAQIDGMSKADLKVSLYSKKGSGEFPETQKVVCDWCVGALSRAIYLPMMELSGLVASEKQRGRWPIAVNRHEIMHGAVADYGTRINSLKVISLLHYYVSLVADKAASGPPAP